MLIKGHGSSRGGYLCAGVVSTQPEVPSGVVYFSGRTSETLLGMGGSDRHLVGAAEGSQSLYIGSATPDLIKAMRGHSELDEPGRIWGGADLPGLMVAASASLHGHGSKLTFLALPLEIAAIPAEAQQFFKGERQALLGTPVFVAVEH
jgi:hypothetical protein